MPRQSPSDSATLYKVGTIKIGNDGNLYNVVDENAFTLSHNTFSFVPLIEIVD